jgi:transketolase
MDAVEQAKSGHPGMPMGMAEIAEALWNGHLRHNPANPRWADRDRFVVSNGHGSMLLYSVLHLSGYDLPLAELRRFRQLHSKTPGHPEVGLTPGVETTTGPLGQGITNAVGMAIAEKVLAATFNRPGHTIVDHHTFVLLGDGCLMEGISHEACSLAGTLGLGKLIALYDDNGISIDGKVQGWFTDDTPARFKAYGWHVIAGIDGHDAAAVDRAIAEAKAVMDRPSLVCCRTVIGKGAPNKGGSAKAHGAPLGADEVAAARKALGWHHGPFEIPADVYAGWDARARGAQAEAAWETRFAAYARAFPQEAAEFRRRMAGALPEDFAARADALTAGADPASIATRKSSEHALNAFGPLLPELIGGSADLAESNLTIWKGSKPVSRETGGNYLFFGVREFAMCAIENGIALHGGLIPYGATFLTFSDYARNALRMAALMKLRALFVFTHDSIGLGEDGPTHQSVEHTASLRLIPQLDVWRPCDTAETFAAWRAGIERTDGPTCFVLTRQNLPQQPRTPAQLGAILRGGYVLADAADGRPQAVLIATGSEIGLATGARDALAARGIAVRVVSMPSTSVFDRQDAAWRASVLPPGIPRVAVEAGVSDLWRKYVGLEGEVVGIDRYGESAPGPQVFEHFGFTVANVVAAVERVLAPSR